MQAQTHPLTRPGGRGVGTTVFAAASRGRPSDAPLGEGGSEPLPPTLIPDRALRRLHELASQTPPAFRTFGFEVRLAGQDGAVDLGIPIERNGRGDLTRWCEEHRGGHTASPGLHHIGRFARAWSSRRALRARIPFVFLEYDASQPSVCATPSVFVALDTLLTSPGRRREAAALRRVIDTSVRLLGAGARSVSDRFRRCVDALPPEAHVLHIAVLLGRPGRPARVSVVLPTVEMQRYFDAIQLRFDADRIAGVRRRFDPSQGDLVQLDFDLAPHYGGSVGVTFKPEDEGQWRTMIDRLVVARLCSPLKGRELLLWPRSTTVRSGVFGMPVRLERFLSHVKLTCRAGARPAAKAYFGGTSHFAWVPGTPSSNGKEHDEA